jgi:hypothetical protein
MDVSSIDSPVIDLAFSPTGELAVAGKEHVWIATATATARMTVGRGDDEVTCVAFDGRRLAIASKESGLRIVELGGKPHVTQIEAKCHWHMMVWAPDGKYIIGAHYEPFLTVIDVEARALLRELDPDEFDDSGRTALLWVDGTLVSTAYNKLVRWRFADVIANKKKCRSKSGVQGHAHFCDVTRVNDGSLFVLAEVEGHEAYLQRFTPSGEKIGNKLAVDPGTRRIGSLGDSLVLVEDEGARIVSLDGEQLRELDAFGSALAISPTTIAIGNERGVRLIQR